MVAALFTAYAIEGIPPVKWARLLLDQVIFPHLLIAPPLLDVVLILMFLGFATRLFLSRGTKERLAEVPSRLEIL